MELQAQISADKLKERIGKSYDMIVDSVTEEGAIVARSKYEAPDIDGVITIDDPSPEIRVQEGDFIRGTITDSDEHDMTAELDANITSHTHIPFARR